MARLGMLELDVLPPMQVLETLDSEDVIAQRMLQFKNYWQQHDPPFGAVYDVANLEFDPIRITEEAAAYLELLVRDRVNQAAKAVTLAFASGTDLDAIGSRYPGGMPRLTNESDDRYRERVWLSPNALSPNGSSESYVLWAMTVDATLRDVTATATPGKPTVTITCLADGDEISYSNGAISSYPTSTPTKAQLNAITTYIAKDSRKAMTDVIAVKGPKITKISYVIRYWAFPGWDRATLEPALYAKMADLLESQRWLGCSHVKAAVEGALRVSGVFNVKVDTPSDDVIIEPTEMIEVTSVTLTYVGKAGYEPPLEP